MTSPKSRGDAKPESPTPLATGLGDRYRIERELGAGGMATVYLAEDLKHRRKVAIKVLNAELSAVLGPERFLKEIELTASLQHPHILPLFDSGSADGLLYYVMPYVEGETLRARLDREQQLPLRDAVQIATEVAGALEYAHERGVVHRDIKPENILLQNGHALVADFGIALAVEHAGGQRMTQTGLSLGTPQYMAPEQAMGERAITARADVWALGVVTYEMLTGDPPFIGSTAQAIVAKMLADDPAPPSRHRRAVPPEIDAAVLTALEKLPADRFASAKEFAAALTLDGVHTRPRGRARARADRLSTATRIVAVFGAVGLIAAAWMFLRPRGQLRPLHASLLPPLGCTYSPVGTSNLVQLSPNGELLAFVASCGNDESLWVRSLVTGEMRKLPGTSHAAYPFWSPSGASLGFFAEGRLKRIDLETNAVRDLAPANNGRGGSWSTRDEIVYAPDISGPLYSIAATGGTPKAATFIARDSAEISHRLPYFLPDGRRFLFTDNPLNSMIGAIRVGTLGSRESRVVIDNLSNVAIADGKLLYATGDLLMARAFDARTATASGPPVSLIPGMETWVFRYLGNFTVSASGDVLVYRPAPIERNRVGWFDPRTGTATTVLEAGRYLHVRVAPNAIRMLVEQRDSTDALVTLSLYDVATKSWNPIRSRAKAYYTFAWSADGSRFAFTPPTEPTGRGVVSVVTADGSNTQRLVTGVAADVTDWSPDARSLVSAAQLGGTGWDILMSRMSDGGSRPLVATTADESGPRVSPDGKLLAYASTESGHAELYVTRMPDASGRWQVSENGVWVEQAAHRVPLAWSRNGKALYFADASGRLMSTAIDDGSSLRVGTPVAVAGAPNDIIDLDMSADGRLLLVTRESREERPLELIEHWSAASKRAK